MRLPLAPLAIYCLLQGTPSGVIAAAILAILLEITDLADGFIARRYGVVSDFGKLFDPYADAFCRFTLFVGLYAIDHASLWMILAIFYRDSTVAFLRAISATQQVVLAARPSGKAKAVIQGMGTQVCFIALVCDAWWPESFPNAHAVPWWTMLLITVVTVGTLGDYLYANRALLADAWEGRAPRR